jgi:hypothetical protein
MAARRVGAGKLLAAALSARLDCTVLTYDQYQKEKDSGEEFRELCVNDIFGFSEVTGDVGDVHQLGEPVVVGTMDRRTLRDTRRHRPVRAGSDQYQLFVKTMKGRCVVIDAASDDTVKELKSKIEYWNGISPNHQRLIFGGRQLEDGKRLSDYNIQRESSVFLVSRLCGGGSNKCFINDPALLDPRFDYDFTNEFDNGTLFYRGGEPYCRPYGWERFALDVKGKYEDDTWLGEGGFRTNSSDDEWPVSYHGTDAGAAGNIAKVGYDLTKGRRFRFGKGIYSSPLITVAEEYAQQFSRDGVDYQLVFQNRVSPQERIVIPSAITGARGKYWVQPNDQLIRPYGLCFRAVSSANRSSCTVS